MVELIDDAKQNQGGINITDATNLEELFEIICSHSPNRFYGHWKYRYTNPLDFIQYKRDDNGHFITKGIVNNKTKEYMPFFTTMYATKNRTNETGDDYYKNEIIFDNIVIDLDDHKDFQEAVKQGLKLAKWFNNNGIDVIIYYTGNKGVHLLICFGPIDITNPLPTKQKFIDNLKYATTPEGDFLGKTTPEGKLQPIDTIDDQVKNTMGLRSLPLSRHRTTRNYSLFLNINESIEWNLEYIEEHKDKDPLKAIKNGEPIYIPNTPDIERNKELLEDKLKHLDRMATIEVNTPTYFKDNLNYVDVSGLKPEAISQALKGLCLVFRKLHKEGHRMDMAWRLIHMLRRSEYPISNVKSLFMKLDKQAYIDNNYEYEINRAYRLKPNTEDKLGGITALLEGVEKYAPADEVEELIDYFGGFFKTKAQELQPLQIEDMKCNATLLKDYSTNYLTYHDLYDEYDIKLDLKQNKLRVIETKDNNTLATLKFKYDNKYFDITKADIKSLNKLLETTGHKQLPTLITFYIRKHLEDNKITATTPNNEEDTISNWKNNEENKLKGLFEKRNNKDLARKELGNYMNSQLNIALKYKTHEPLILDKSSNGYEPIELDDIMRLINKNNILEKNSIHTDDIKYALGFISDRIKPDYNYIKCGNGLFNLKTWELEEQTKEPILTAKQTKYNYNPKAEPDETLKKYLNTSYKAKPTGDAEEDKKNHESNIKSLHEITGNSFLIGNPLNVISILLGQQGGGKGVFMELLEELHGPDKVSNIALQQLTTENKHATSDLIGKQVNITRDVTNATITETGIIKNIAGGDPLDAEPKGKQRVKIPSKEVPALIIACNNMPPFKGGLDHTVLTKVVILEYYVEIRGTKQQILNLDERIIDNPENMEYLFYKGLEAIKPVLNKEKQFEGKINELKTMEVLGKHTDPIRHIMAKLVEYYDNVEWEDKITYDGLEEVIRKACKQEGINPTNLNNKGRVTQNKILSVFKEDIVQDDGYATKVTKIDGKSKRYYPKIQKTPYYMDIQELLQQEKEAQEKKETQDTTTKKGD